MYFSSSRLLETFFLDKIILYGNIFDALEKGYFNTQVLQFSCKFNPFSGVLFNLDLPFRIVRYIGLWDIVSIIFLEILRWRRWVSIWEYLPRPKADLLDIHNIIRIGCLSVIDLLGQLVV